MLDQSQFSMSCNVGKLNSYLPMFVLSLLGPLAFLCDLRRGVRRNGSLFHQYRIKEQSHMSQGDAMFDHV